MLNLINRETLQFIYANLLLAIKRQSQNSVSAYLFGTASGFVFVFCVLAAVAALSAGCQVRTASRCELPNTVELPQIKYSLVVKYPKLYFTQIHKIVCFYLFLSQYCKRAVFPLLKSIKQTPRGSHLSVLRIQARYLCLFGINLFY